MTRNDRVWKVIYKELCKKFKFHSMKNWYLHSPNAEEFKKKHNAINENRIL